MGKLNHFSITLTNPQVVYYTGQQIAGYVTVNLNQPMEMRGIQLKLKGKGYCHWSEEHTTGSGDDERTETEHYYGKEKVVEDNRVLHGDMSNKVVHPAGNYVYPFSFTLSGMLPSSFEGMFGYIRYFLKCSIDKPWKFDHKVKKPLIINELIDVNNPMYLEGRGGDAHRDVGCCCCKSGPADMSVSIDRNGYCPGETIFINSFVKNQTTRDFKDMHVKLMQTVTYQASNRTKKYTHEVARLPGPRVYAGQDVNWENQPLGIPATPPTIKNSRVITLQYKIKIVASIPCAIDPTVKMYITMGTVPFMRSYGQQMQYQGGYQPPMPNIQQGMAAPPIPSAMLGYPDMIPPSYSAAVGSNLVNIHGKKDEHTHGDLSYNPVYTFAQPHQEYSNTGPSYHPVHPPGNPPLPPPCIS